MNIMKMINNIHNIDCREGFKKLNDACIHLIIFSPPYAVGKEYELDLDFDSWRELMKDVCAESKRVLVEGGRIAINVANIMRKPYLPLNYYVTGIMLSLGFLMRGEIIWCKGASAGKSTAWGSFGSASNPCLRDSHEYILVFSKGSFKLEADKECENTITKSRFVLASKGEWNIRTESKRFNHPAPFPIEIPKRLIEFYTYKHNIVLDPFLGVGSTAIASLLTERKFIGFEINSEYVAIARNRIESLIGQRKIHDFTRQNDEKTSSFKDLKEWS